MRQIAPHNEMVCRATNPSRALCTVLVSSGLNVYSLGVFRVFAGVVNWGVYKSSRLKLLVCKELRWLGETLIRGSRKNSKECMKTLCCYLTKLWTFGKHTPWAELLRTNYYKIANVGFRILVDRNFSHKTKLQDLVHPVAGCYGHACPVNPSSGNPDSDDQFHV